MMEPTIAELCGCVLVLRHMASTGKHPLDREGFRLVADEVERQANERWNALLGKAGKDREFRATLNARDKRIAELEIEARHLVDALTTTGGEQPSKLIMEVTAPMRALLSGKHR